jgi:hypothetical protein
MSSLADFAWVNAALRFACFPASQPEAVEVVGAIFPASLTVLVLILEIIVEISL